MSVESEILRIQHNIANTYAAVSEKGGEVPLQPTSANLAAAVASIPVIPTGGSKGDLLTKSSSVDYDAAWTGLPQIGSELVKTDNPVGAALSGKASNPNLLDNWYFADPINQRGQTVYTNGYTIDRWYIIGSGQVEIVDGGIKLTQASSYQLYWIYKFDPYISKILAGKTVTFSTLVPAASADLALNIFSGNRWIGSTGSVVGLNSTTITLPNDFADLSIQFGGENAGYATIQAVKVELGPVQTLAHQDADGNWSLNDPPPNKALELAKCQWYQKAYTNTDCIGIAAGNIILIQKPCMRTNPTVVQNGAKLDVAGASVGLNELTFESAQWNGAFMVCRGQKDFGVGGVFVQWDSPAYLILDAN